MVYDKVVRVRWCEKDGVLQSCVRKMVCCVTNVCDRGAAEEEAEEAGYRINNKNPTQRCWKKPYLQSVQ